MSPAKRQHVLAFEPITGDTIIAPGGREWRVLQARSCMLAITPDVAAVLVLPWLQESQRTVGESR